MSLSQDVFLRAEPDGIRVGGQIHSRKHSTGGEHERAHSLRFDDGRSDGRPNAVVDCLMRLLRRKLGDEVATPSIRDRLQDMSLDILKNLTEEILDFETAADFRSWLEQNSTY